LKAAAPAAGRTATEAAIRRANMVRANAIVGRQYPAATGGGQVTISRGRGARVGEFCRAGRMPDMWMGFKSRRRLLPRDGRRFGLPVVENPSRPNDQYPEPEAEQYRKQRPISFRVQLSASVRLIVTSECLGCVHEQKSPFGFGRVWATGAPLSWQRSSWR
jgi:hypothetical protein